MRNILAALLIIAICNIYLMQVLRRWRHRWKSTGHTPLLAQQVIKCIEIAESCIENEPKKRPSLSDIIHDLDETGNKTGHISAAGRVSSAAPENKIIGSIHLERTSSNIYSFSNIPIRTQKYRHGFILHEIFIRKKNY